MTQKVVQKVVSCYILNRTLKITIDLFDRNTIYDKNGSYEVPFDLLTFDHLRKLIWNNIKSDEEDINEAKQLKLWLGKKSKNLERNFRDGVAPNKKGVGPDRETFFRYFSIRVYHHCPTTNRHHW
jgi:hypothetical protein